MDNETHYLTYDPEAIWNAMISAYVEAGGDILYPGDEKEMLLRAVQAIIIQAFAGVDNALRMSTLRYALGDYLDLYGSARGCERIEAKAAISFVEIITNATGKKETIPAGTLMTADGKVYFYLVEDLVLSGFSQTFDMVKIIAEKTGTSGNGIPTFTQMQLAIPNPAINSIMIVLNSYGGADRETDDSYRERIKDFGYTLTTAGPAKQYEIIAKSSSSSILDVKAVGTAAEGGVVYVYVLLADGASDDILNDVRFALNDETVRPLTDSVAIIKATNVPYTLNVKYTADGSVGDAIADAVAEYKEWQDNHIGLAFNPDRLMAAIYQAGATRVIWGTGSNFNGGTVQYTEIESSERCKGTITLGPII